MTLKNLLFLVKPPIFAAILLSFVFRHLSKYDLKFPEFPCGSVKQ